MLNAYMTDTVILIRRNGTASWGEKSTSRTTVRARVEDVNKLVRTPSGEMTLLKAVVYLKVITLLPSDRIEINGVEHPVLTIKISRAFSSESIMEVGIG